jgi:HPt (histidine-containing phosphotransfer) domain-containing protein
MTQQLMLDPADIAFEEALEQLGGDRELLGEVVAIFLETAPDQIGQIEEALASGDMVRLQTVAHGLKGSAAAIGALEVSRTALELETLAQQGGDGDSAEILARLRGRIEELDRASAEMVWQGDSRHDVG